MTAIDTPYPVILGCLACTTIGFALAMSPMTAAIMSAVPQRRAGAGSAMNDASRELGAAFGVAVMGSLASSQYRGRRRRPHRAAAAVRRRRGPVVDRRRARASPSDSPGRPASCCDLGAEHAFIDGFHFAVTAGSLLALLAAFLTVNFLPRDLTHEGALRDGISAMEDVAELGLGGVPPIFADSD